MISHRRVLHFRTRKNLPKAWRLQLRNNTDVKVVIDQRIERRRREYLVVLEDGGVEWRKMPKNDFRVKHFLFERKNKNWDLLRLVDVKEWARGLTVD